MKARLAALLLALAAPLAAQLRPVPVPSPAAADSQCSNLTAAPDGTLLLTWYGPGDRPGERALCCASLAPGAAAWSEPRTIASTPLLMENWADFASLVVGTDGALTAQWFQRASADARGYDGWYSRSDDGGRTWRAPARLGHEFVALAPLSQGRTLAVWLESARVRSAAPAGHDHAAPRPARDPKAPYAPSMKLLARLLAPDGQSLGEWTVDPDVCTCCQNTAAVLPGDRVFIGYRGHTP
ncbi:MAG TPA: sialidase family protein, partial [Opitutaceae bacterium]